MKDSGITGSKEVAISEAVDQATALCLRLDDGECGGSYLESALLMSALISAIASECWPGKKIDRKRFIELWARHSKNGGNMISIPSLAQALRRQGRDQEAQKLETLKSAIFQNQSQILTGPEVDLSEPDVAAALSSLSGKEIRGHCYAAIFYTYVRSALAHEYAIRTGASAWTMSSDKENVSYLNTVADSITTREIHFPIRWLSRLVKDLASAVDKLSLPIAKSTSWWIEG